MPRKVEMSLETLAKDWYLLRALNRPLEAIVRCVHEEGARLVMEESLFSDGGADYCALYLVSPATDEKPESATCVAYMPGY